MLRLTAVASRLFVAGAVLLTPWAVAIYMLLPSTMVVERFDLAWAGFDVIVALTMVVAAWALARRSRVMPIATSAVGALLLVDGWFDIALSGGGQELAVSIALFCLVEAPLAVGSLWLAYHAQQLREP